MQDDSMGERRDTHVTHTRLDRETDDITPDRLYWEERRVLERKARLILDGRLSEPRTEWLSMRVGHTLKELYRRAPPGVKKAARAAFERVILGWFTGGGDYKAMELQNGAPLILNMSVSISESKSESNASVTINNKIVMLVDRLYELRASLPPVQRKLVEELYKTVRGN